MRVYSKKRNKNRHKVKILLRFEMLGGMVDIMKILIKIFAVLLFLTNCSSITVPSDYGYQEVETRDFTIATWQKITNPQGVYKIYIEGDGYAFNAHGKPTQNPTPHGTLVRELAFGDSNHANILRVRFVPNVIGQPLVLHLKLLM